MSEANDGRAKDRAILTHRPTQRATEPAPGSAPAPADLALTSDLITYIREEKQ